MSVDLNSYINKEINCSCGHKHYSNVKKIDISPNAVTRLPQYIQDFGYRKVFLVADINTWKAAGKIAADELLKTNIKFEKIILQANEPVPDEQTIGQIMTAIPMDTDLIIGVGSGTINDLCKFVSHRMGKDYFIFASAPSMDGFVSIGSALMLKHVKTTLDCHGPVAVIGDVNILSQAPMRLIAAGLGDTLGKYTCLLDWKLSHFINGEYYCEEVVSMVETAVDIVKQKGGLVQYRDPEAIQAVTEALVLTGIAMSYIGNSRPASGCEHHMSHYWEMNALMNGKTPALHGTQVGVGLIVALKLYHELAGEHPDFSAILHQKFDYQEWEQNINKVYGTAAEEIISLENNSKKNDITSRNNRLKIMEQNWSLIQQTIESSLPSTQAMEEMLQSLNAPISPAEIDINQEETWNAVVYAKEVRNRYTLLQMLWDLGISKKYADRVIEYFATKSDS